MFSRYLSRYSAAAAVLLVAVSVQAQDSQNPSTSGAVVSPVSQSAPQFQQRYPRYKIHNQDTLLLSFPLSPELNQTITVQPDGYVNLQTAGSLHIVGMTVPEVTDALKVAYAEVLNNPIINVDLEDYQKPFFTVSGQVGKPGQYDLRADITVSEALAVAGGLSPTARTQVLLYHHTSDDSVEVRQLNLKEVLHGKKVVEEDATIKPGDMIFVPEKFITNFKKYVPYGLTTGAYVNP